MTIEEKINLGVQKFLQGKGTLTEIRKQVGLPNTIEMSQKLTEMGYFMYTGAKYTSVVGLKLAVEEYIQNYNNKPSLSKLSKKYKIGSKTISDKLKSLGYEIINHQNKIKFDECIFDSIDTEEKAYWLGFIFADGYISNYDKLGNNRWYFELSLNAEDKSHLDKFNKFMKHVDDNHVKINSAKCFNTESVTKRCRWAITNKHLWETLNSYGCIPSKSLILQFPNENIFKSNDLIKHFIRGYWDGDGCLTYTNKEYNNAVISVLGTEDFLSELKNNLPLKFDYKLASKDDKLTKILSIHGKNAFELSYYLYNDATIYLQRKYDRYLEYCRIYEESYILLQVKNGKIITNNNTVLNI